MSSTAEDPIVNGAASDVISRPPIAVVGIVILLAMVGILSNMDRVLLSVLAEPVKAEFSLSDTQFGALSGVIFASVYTLGAIPIARLADVYGRAWVLGGCIIFWSVCTALTGAAGSFIQLAFARAGVGLGEAGSSPSIHALVGENVPPAWRARALAVIGASLALGGMISLWVGGLLAERFGWRPTFLIAAAAGIVIGVLVAVLLRRPRDQPAPVAPKEQKTSFWAVLRQYCAEPVFLLRTAAAVAATITIAATGAWTAAFAMRAYGLSLSEVGAWLGFGTGCMVLGNFLGAMLVGRTGPRGEVTMPIPALCCIASAVFFVIGFLSGSWPMTIGFFIAGSSLCSTYYPPIYAAIQADAPPHARAQLAAIVLVLTSSLGIGVGPTMVGMISDATVAELGTRSLGLGLAIGSSFSAVAGLCMLLADHVARKRARATIP